MLFKKSNTQGGFILGNGTRIEFDADGYFETDKESIIAELSEVYEVVESREVSEEVQEEIVFEILEPAVATGPKSSATIANVTKK